MESMRKWWNRRKEISEERRQRLSLQSAEYDARLAYDKIKKFLDSFEVLHRWEKQFGTSRYNIAAAILIIGSYAFIMFIGLDAFINVVGLLYPGYQSYKTIESSIDEVEYLQWMMYWVVFGCLHLFEMFLSAIWELSTMYLLIKLLFLCFCFAPETRGASIIYEHLVRPFLNKHEDRIDNHLDKFRQVGGQAADEIGQISSKFIGAAASNMAKTFVTTLASPKELDSK